MVRLFRACDRVASSERNLRAVCPSAFSADVNGQHVARLHAGHPKREVRREREDDRVRLDPADASSVV